MVWCVNWQMWGMGKGLHFVFQRSKTEGWPFFRSAHPLVSNPAIWTGTGIGWFCPILLKNVPIIWDEAAKFVWCNLKGFYPPKKNRKIWPCLGFLNVFQNLLSSPGEASKKLWSFFYLNLIIWHPKHILSHCERSQKDIFHALYQKYPSAIRAACAISEISIHNESGLCYFRNIHPQWEQLVLF